MQVFILIIQEMSKYRSNAVNPAYTVKNRNRAIVINQVRRKKMNENQEPQVHSNNIFGVLVGMLIGSLAGAVTMLLLAPQSGKDTRTQLREKGIELRDRTTGMVQDTMEQVRSSANKITMSGREKAKELLQQGEALVIEQLDHVSDAAKAGKKAIQNS
jgi:gas vesicle protein